MPNVHVIKRELFEKLGREFTDEHFEDLCFEYGLEVEFTDTSDMMNRQGDDKEVEPVFKVEVPANRYDLLSVEGLVTALRAYLEIEKPTKVTYVAPENPVVVTVQQDTEDVRKHVVAAVLRNITFTQESYNSFIELQDLLHFNICRRRTLASMGTHDLDKVTGNITYEAHAPEEISFIALKQDEEMNCVELFDELKKDLKLKPYLGIIKDLPKYPVFYDEDRKVLSLPPIINSEATKISPETKNVFIEITATDLHRAEVALNILVSQFAQYCEKAYTVEQVKVVQPNGEHMMYPRLLTQEFTVGLNYTNKLLGLNIPMSDVPGLLGKMGLECKETREDDFDVIVPPQRADILHACDISEDIGVAFGFNNIPRVVPPTLTSGKALPLNKFTDLLRQELAQAGFVEILTSGLISKKEEFDYLRQKYEPHVAVQLANSKTKEYDFVRTTLLPGLLKTLHSNKGEKLPHKLFECADVCLIDDESDTGARNERRVGVLYSDNKTSGLQYVHGMLDLIMKKFAVPNDAEKGYSIEESNNPTYFDQRQVRVLLKGEPIGNFGILHPEVVKSYKINNPCSVLELNAEKIFKHFEETMN